MAAAVAQERAQLCNLLGYAEEILKIGERVVSDLSKDSLLSFYEHDVTNLEGVGAPGGDDCWLRVSRLREVDAPDVEPIYQSWLTKAASAGPFERPRLAETSLVFVSPEVASDLMEAGFATDDDIMKPLVRAAENPGHVDVLLRLERMPEFRHGFAEWVDC